MSKEVQLAWEQFEFSDPKTATQDSFAFIIHAFDPEGTTNMITMLGSMQATGHQNFDHTQNIDLFHQPQRISEKRQISCSVIGRNSTQETQVLSTFKPIGFILKVPHENIVAASTQDMGFYLGHTDEELDKQREKIDTSPQDLLSYTAYQYNEVVVRGKTEHGKVEIAGVFLNPNMGAMTEEEYTSLRQQANMLASRVGKPLFELPEQVIKGKDSPITIGESSLTEDELYTISMTKNGRSYIALTSFTPIRFYCQNGHSGLRQKMSKEEFEIFMSEIPNLPEKAHTKYAEILTSLSEQYDEFKKVRPAVQSRPSMFSDTMLRRPFFDESFLPRYTAPMGEGIKSKFSRSLDFDISEFMSGLISEGKRIKVTDEEIGKETRDIDTLDREIYQDTNEVEKDD